MLDRHKYTVDPNGRLMRLWDPVTLVALVYVALVLPAELAFPTTSVALTAVNRFIDCVFVIDMFLQFFLAFADPVREWPALPGPIGLCAMHC